MGSSPGKFNTKARISKPSALFSWLIQLKARRKHQPGQKKHHIPTTMIFKSNCPTITYIASKRLQVRTTSSHKDLEPVTQISTKAQLNWTVRLQLQKVMGDNVCVCADFTRSNKVTFCWAPKGTDHLVTYLLQFQNPAATGKCKNCSLFTWRLAALHSSIQLPPFVQKELGTFQNPALLQPSCDGEKMIGVKRG